MTTPYLTPPVFSWPAAPGGKLHCYLAGGTVPQATYSDAAGVTPNTNPVTLDSLGSAVVRLAVGVAYHFTLKDSSDTTTLWDADNYDNAYLTSGTLTAPIVGAVLYPQTAAEATAGISPTNLYDSPWGYDVRRVGVVPNSAGSGAANYTALKALFNPGVTGPTGKFIFPNTTGADIYYIGVAGATCIIPVRDGCQIDLQGCSLIFNGTGVSAADANCGCFFALRDFELKNGTITVNWATGAFSSGGNAIQCGTRGADSSLFPATWDAALATPQGKIFLHDLRITMNVTGVNLSSVAAIVLIGGLQGVRLENIFINGSGTLQQGITNEFGWATSDTQPSARQTSHMHNFLYRNIQITNMDNASALSIGIVLAGAYQGVIENYSFSGVSNGLISSSGESMFYRPWTGVDDVAGKRVITLRNITGSNFSNAGLNLSGATARSAGSGYLQRAWMITTAYGVRETVVNGGNMYVCTVGGTSAGAGGPGGTGTGIVDGGVTWNYVPLTANTDQLDYVLEGFAFNAGTLPDAIDASAGYVSIRNGTITGCNSGIFLFGECTRFEIIGVRCTGAQLAGFNLSSAAGAIWSPQRLRKGVVRDCYVCNNSVAVAGAQPGIAVNFTDSMLIENNRINADSAYNGVADTTQGNGVQVSTTASGVVCRSNHVGTVVAGGTGAYVSLLGSGILNGNDVQSPRGTSSIVGPWNADGTGSATTTQLTDKTHNINTVGKYFNRRCLNTTTSKYMWANGALVTDIWVYVDNSGNIVPV